MLRLKVIKTGNSNDQGTAVADADDHPDRPDVGALHSRSRQGARAHGLHGQPVAERQSAIGVGAAALFRAFQCGRKSDHFRAADGTVIACAVYFWSRLVHAIVYTMGVPVVRTLAFAVGFLAQAALVLAVFGKL
jgi:uncharacterized MAPEG superfamily protein